MSSTTETSYDERYDDFTINFARYFLNYMDDYQYSTSTLIETYMCKKDYCPCVQIENATARYPEGFNNPPIM